MMTVSICSYDSPLGGICLAADALGLTGLWFGEVFWLQSSGEPRPAGD